MCVCVHGLNLGFNLNERVYGVCVCVRACVCVSVCARARACVCVCIYNSHAPVPNVTNPEGGRLVNTGTKIRFCFSSPFSSKVVVCGHCLVTLSLTVKETFKWISSLPIFNAGVILLVTVSRQVISLLPHLHPSALPPPPPLFPRD